MPQSRMFKLLGIGPEEAEARFGFFLEALRYPRPARSGANGLRPAHPRPHPRSPPARDTYETRVFLKKLAR
jgi:hypothetical protein